MPQKIQQRLRRPLPTHLTSANMRQKSHRFKKIQAAKPVSDVSKNQDKFYSLKKELDAIDHELDTLDDDYEHQYDTGKLSAAKYKEIERRIDALEDKLDFAEDTLENKFGIDD